MFVFFYISPARKVWPLAIDARCAVKAQRAVQGGVTAAHVNVVLAVFPCEAVAAEAGVLVNEVHAGAFVQAGLGGALLRTGGRRWGWLRWRNENLISRTSQNYTAWVLRKPHFSLSVFKKENLRKKNNGADSSQMNWMKWRGLLTLYFYQSSETFPAWQWVSTR